MLAASHVKSLVEVCLRRAVAFPLVSQFRSAAGNLLVEAVTGLALVLESTLKVGLALRQSLHVSGEAAARRFGVGALKIEPCLLISKFRGRAYNLSLEDVARVTLLFQLPLELRLMLSQSRDVTGPGLLLAPSLIARLFYLS